MKDEKVNSDNKNGGLSELFPLRDLLMSTDGVFYATSEDEIELHGVTVFSEFQAEGEPDLRIPELLKRAREKTDASGKVTLVLTGSGITSAARSFFAYGADRIFVYDDPAYQSPEGYKDIFRHFLTNYKPDSIMGTGNKTGKAMLGCLAGAVIGFPGKPVRISPEFTPDPSRRGELIICKL